MNARDHILRKLRAAQTPFAGVAPLPDDQRIPVSPRRDTRLPALLARFIDEAEKLSCHVQHLPPAETCEAILALIGDDRRVLSWSAKHIPLAGWSSTLEAAGIAVAQPQEDHVRVGITGVTYALAATGSLVLYSGAGRYRATSLLPDVHIAVMTPDQLLPDFESWVALHRSQDTDGFRAPSNTVVISGPSKTADIAQELIKGAHGPRSVHIFIVESDIQSA